MNRTDGCGSCQLGCKLVYWGGLPAVSFFYYYRYNRKAQRLWLRVLTRATPLLT